jgi:hypothetical protein
MWDGWVSPEQEHTYIIGHWNYPEQTVKNVYVVSTADSVELVLNGRSLGCGERSMNWLFTFKDVQFEPGTLEAIGYSYASGQASPSRTSSYKLETAGQPVKLQLTAIQNPEGIMADGADMVLYQIEVLDAQGRRCPLDNRMVHFQLWGEARWIGGIGTRNNSQYQQDNARRDSTLLDSANKKNLSDNYVGHMSLPVECGVNRVLVRTTTTAGEIGLSVCADGLQPAYINLQSQAVATANYLPQRTLPCRLDRGPTPLTASYNDVFQTVNIASVKAGSNDTDAVKSYDDNELSEWKSDGERDNAWITYRLARRAMVSEITLKLTGWRNKCYPLEVWAGNRKVWEGMTDATLGYAHIHIAQPVRSDRITLRMVGPAQDSSRFGDTKELAGGNAGELDRLRSAPGRVELRIVEIDMLESMH